MQLWTAFTIGLVGSLHCVGMCGAIALALPHKSSNRWRMLSNASLYNIGRITTYSLIGIFFGLLGKGVSMAGFQQGLSISVGILLLVVALFSINVEQHIANVPFIKNFMFQLRMRLGKLLKIDQPNKQNQSLYLIGILNGLLPCGLVYMAVAGSLTAGSIERSALYMALFGLGTVPLMLTTAVLGNFVGIKIRNRVKRFVPIMMILFAGLFIVRGANLGIPYLSPKLIDTTTTSIEDIPMCHGNEESE